MISILMPVFNAEEFIEECLESIVEQSVEDWELIAVDDFSTDDSFKYLAAYASIEDRIKLFKNTEKGIIPALRLAYSHAKGDHITRMDADDVMYENKLELLREHCQEGQIATGKVSYFRSDGELGPGFIKYADWLNDLVDKKRHYKEIYKECVIPSPAWMMTRATLDKVGAFQANQYPEDYDLVFRCYEKDIEVNPTSVTIHGWRDHSQRASRTDPKYMDNWFLDIKMKYFLQIDYNSDIPLVLWGAGKKGKICARYLLDEAIPFVWITDNPNKLSAPIFHQQLQATDKLPSNAQCIITVAGPDDQKEIKKELATSKDVQAFWFC